MNTEHFKQKLEAELESIEQSLADVAKKNSSGEWDTRSDENDMTATEPDELADRAEEFEVHREETDVLQGRERNIKRALAKIEEGKYGMCEVSGEAIEAERLEVNPSARTCMEHKEEETSLPL